MTHDSELQGMISNSGWGWRPVTCKKNKCPGGEDSQALGTVGEQGDMGSYIRHQMILCCAKHAELTWEGDMLKNCLKAWNKCRLICKGMLKPKKQLEGLGFGGSLMQHVPKKQTHWFSFWMLSTLCSGVSQWSDCHLHEHTPGVYFHYRFVWQIMAGGWHDYPDVSDQDLITRT